MVGRVSTFVSRARAKAVQQLSFAAHTAGHWYARSKTKVESDPVAEQRADQLRRQGHLTIPADPRVSTFLDTDYKQGMAPAWDANDRTWRDPPTGSTYKVFLANIAERWPATQQLIDGDTGAALRAYYGCHFQLSYIEPYRTFPAEGELPKSWLWHYDAVAPGVLKLMIYLNGATAQTGALRVVDRENSAELERLGYRSRADSDAFAKEFENRHVVLGGPPGSGVIIDNRVLHKATAPEHGHRDVVCFQILPSLVPESEARTRVGRSRSYAPATPQFPLFPPLR